MRKFWIAAMTAGLFTMTAIAQTSANGSAAGNASVTPGQASAGASTSQSAQAPGASANVNGSGSAQASHEKQNNKHDKNSSTVDNPSAGADNKITISNDSATNPDKTLSSKTTLQAKLS